MKSMRQGRTPWIIVAEKYDKDIIIDTYLILGIQHASYTDDCTHFLCLLWHILLRDHALAKESWSLSFSIWIFWIDYLLIHWLSHTCFCHANVKTIHRFDSCLPCLCAGDLNWYLGCRFRMTLFLRPSSLHLRKNYCLIPSLNPLELAHPYFLIYFTFIESIMDNSASIIFSRCSF